MPLDYSNNLRGRGQTAPVTPQAQPQNYRGARPGSGPTAPIPTTPQQPNYRGARGPVYQPPIKPVVPPIPKVPAPVTPQPQATPTPKPVEPTPVPVTPPVTPKPQVEQQLPPDQKKDALLNFVQGEDLTPGQNIPDPTKKSAAGQTYEEQIFGKINNPEANVSKFGDIRDEKIMNQLKTGVIPGMENLTGETERAKSRDLTRSEDQARELVLRSGLTPNDPGYAKALRDARAGAIDRNIDRDFETASIKNKSYADALKTAGDINKDKTAGKETALGQLLGIDETGYERGQTKFTQGETARLEKKAENQALINSVQDPRAKQFLQTVANEGGDIQAAYNEIMGVSKTGGKIGGADAGTIQEQFRSATPANVEVEGMKDKAKAMLPRLPGESDADYNKRIDQKTASMFEQIFNSEYTAPLEVQAEQKVAKGINEKLNTLKPGQILEPNEFEEARKQGLIKQYTATSVPRNPKEVNQFLRENPNGIISLDGKQFRVESASSPRTGRTKYTNSPRHTDELVVVDEKGNKKYVYNGKINDAPVKRVGDVQITPFGF